MKTANFVSTIALALAMTVQPMTVGVAQNAKPKLDNAVVDIALQRVTSLPEVIYVVDKLARTAANPADVYLRAIDLFPEYKLSIIALAHATSIEIPIIIDILDFEEEEEETPIAAESAAAEEIGSALPSNEQTPIDKRPLAMMDSPEVKPHEAATLDDSGPAEAESQVELVAPSLGEQAPTREEERTIAISLPGGFTQVAAPESPKSSIPDEAPDVPDGDSGMSAREFTLGEISTEKLIIGTSIAAVIGGLFYVAFDGSEGGGHSEEDDEEIENDGKSLSRISAAASVEPTKVSLLMPFGPDQNGMLSLAVAGEAKDVVSGDVGSRSLDANLGGNPFVIEDDTASSLAFDLEGREFAVAFGEDGSAFRSSIGIESGFGNVEIATGFVHTQASAEDLFTGFVGAEIDWSVTNRWSLQPSAIAAVSQTQGESDLSAVVSVDLVGHEIITKNDEVVLSVSQAFENSSSYFPSESSVDGGLGLSASWSTPIGEEARLSMALSHHVPTDGSREQSSSLMVGFGLRF